MWCANSIVSGLANFKSNQTQTELEGAQFELKLLIQRNHIRYIYMIKWSIDKTKKKWFLNSRSYLIIKCKIRKEKELSEYKLGWAKLCRRDNVSDCLTGFGRNHPRDSTPINSIQYIWIREVSSGRGKGTGEGDDAALLLARSPNHLSSIAPRSEAGDAIRLLVDPPPSDLFFFPRLTGFMFGRVLSTCS